MPILHIKQPEIISVKHNLRLRKYDGNIMFALEWYQDLDTIYLVDGNREPYTLERLKAMYEYLDKKGELYFIEVLEKEGYRPVGDVTFCREDMPIVIGCKEYRGRGIGRDVIAALIARAKELGYAEIFVEEIYSYNIASQKCFESVGFRSYKKTDRGAGYRLLLKSTDTETR